MTGLELRRRVMLSMREQGLPSKYQEVEYLQSNGNQYIDSGFAPGNNGGEFTFEVDYIRNSTTYGALMGSRSENDRRNWIYASRNSQQFGYGNTYLDIQYSSNSWIKAKTYITENSYVGELTSNGVSRSYSFTKQTFINTANIYLFTSYNNGAISSYVFSGYVKAAKLYDNGTIVRNFIPCYRKADNKPGMYDLVSRKFFTNAGTGDFIVGPDVN